MEWLYKLRGGGNQGGGERTVRSVYLAEDKVNTTRFFSQSSLLVANKSITCSMYKVV